MNLIRPELGRIAYFFDDQIRIRLPLASQTLIFLVGWIRNRVNSARIRNPWLEEGVEQTVIR